MKISCERIEILNGKEVRCLLILCVSCFVDCGMTKVWNMQGAILFLPYILWSTINGLLTQSHVLIDPVFHKAFLNSLRYNKAVRYSLLQCFLFIKKAETCNFFQKRWKPLWFDKKVIFNICFSNNYYNSTFCKCSTVWRNLHFLHCSCQDRKTWQR
jgi:hypothetical protein